jgi:hypothetical protein
MPFAPRFRVRTLLVGVAIAALLAAWPAAEWRRQMQEQAILRRLEAKDVHVVRRIGIPYSYATNIYADDYVRRSPQSGSPDEPRPPGFRLTADDIRAIATLRELRDLQLHGDVLEPEAYAALGELKQIETLRISRGSWDDERLRYLEPLVGLQELTLEQTQTTEQGVARLQEKLPKLAIADD